MALQQCKRSFILNDLEQIRLANCLQPLREPHLLISIVVEHNTELVAATMRGPYKKKPTFCQTPILTNNKLIPYQKKNPFFPQNTPIPQPNPPPPNPSPKTPCAFTKKKPAVYQSLPKKLPNLPTKKTPNLNRKPQRKPGPLHISTRGEQHKVQEENGSSVAYRP